MQIIRSSQEMTAWSNEVLAGGENIALVPTMGCFHEGHLSLMRLAAEKATKVVVSLFVNPIQFGPNEDFDNYPRVFDKDVVLAEKERVAVVFAPAADEFYPVGFQSEINVGGLSDRLCGASRPGHFTGVTTVVGKLFNIVKPAIAIFGEKDFQQLAIIRKMVKDLNWDIEISGHPIVRELDGLAMSSRNVYLSAQERLSALSLSRCLAAVKKNAASGESDADLLLDRAAKILQADPLVNIDYLEIVDGFTLLRKQVVDRNSYLLMAVKIGKTRLIDNGRLLDN